MTLRELIRWARREYHLEAPPLAIHEGYTHIGEGGAPKNTAAFIRYLTLPPWAVDPMDPSWYQTPLRAALARIARRDPLSAQIAQLLAMGEFNAHDVVAIVAPTVPAELRVYCAFGAMEKLNRVYRERTPIPERQTSWIDLSESQQQALLHGPSGSATLPAAE